MKNVTFSKVGMVNFSCFKSLMEFELKNNSITLISGPNGTGKSTIFDAIPFTLYGISPKGLRGEDVVNNEVGKDCHTFVEFQIDDSKYRVDRFVKHTKMGDTVLISKDGQKPYKKGQKEIVPEIEKLLIPEKLFTNTLLFGQKVKTFFTDLSNSDQKDIFRKVLQLDDYITFYDECNRRLKLLDIQIEELKRKIDVSRKTIGSLDIQLVLLEKEKEDFYTEKEEKLEEYKYLFRKFEEDLKDLDYGDVETTTNLEVEESNLISEKKAEEIKKETLESEEDSKKLNAKSKYDLKLSEFQSTLKEKKSVVRENYLTSRSLIKEGFETTTHDIKLKLSEILSNIKNLNNRILDNTKTLKSSKEEISRISKEIGKDIVICFACKQEVGADKIKHLKEHLDEKINNYNNLDDSNKHDVEEVKSLSGEEEVLQSNLDSLSINLENELSNLQKNYDEENSRIDKEFNDAKNKLDQLLKNILESIENEYNDKIRIVNDKISSIDKKIKEIKEKIKHSKYIEDLIVKLKEKIQTYKTLIKDLEVKEFNDNRIKVLSKKIEDLNKEKKDYEEDLEKGLKRLEVFEFWKKGFSMSGIPSMLIDEAIPFMNKKIKEYLELLGGRYIVSFDTLSETKAGEIRDKISVHVLDTITKSNNRKAFSGGQTRIVDVATIFTLHDLQSVIQDMKINILLLDEIFDSLDDTNISYVSSLLRMLMKEKSINIISHRNVDSIEYDEHFKFF